jgi:DNA polymerase-3 subunit delta'
VTYPWLEQVESEFAERLNSNRLPHALLISGPAETGKLNLAIEIMTSLLCLQNTHPACGTCRSCQLLASGAHPDRHFITFEEHPRTGDPRREIVVEQIRRLIASLYLTNTISARKVALIHPVEAMNTHAANALLKTLEEPPGDANLILVSDDPLRLPATIRSRCQNLHVRPPDRENALMWLCDNSDFDQHEAGDALEAAAGSPLAALRIMEDGTVIQYRLVSETLDHLISGRVAAGAAMAALADVEPLQLWSWLSLRAAAELKTVLAEGNKAKSLSLLQAAADRSRKLLPTPVRKDLLLQDWLIQWSRIKA